MRPGVRACDLYDFCRKAFADEGLRFSRPHVGHSFSLGGHDNPMLQPGEEAVLEADMVFYVEPVYIDSGYGGYHLEDLVLVTEGEPEILVDYSSTEQLFTIDWHY
jgi:Xaa-Pro aminopeptidase